MLHGCICARILSHRYYVYLGRKEEEEKKTQKEEEKV